MDKPQATILIVDDQPVNIQVLSAVLRKDYQLLVADRGEAALKIIESQHPDLILLDVDMPEMGGHEVCDRVKCNELTQDIPVIFVTARAEIEDEQRGLELGAVDYIHKPVTPGIVRLRVAAHLSIKQQRDQLRDSVSETERDAAYHRGISEMSSHLFHNVGNAVMGVESYMEGLSAAAQSLQQLEELLSQQQQRVDRGEGSVLTFQQISKAVAQLREIHLTQRLEQATAAAHHMVEILDAQRQFVDGESPFLPVHFSLSDAVYAAIAVIRGRVEKSGVVLDCSIEQGLPAVYLPKNPLQQLIVNLLKNAVEAVDERRLDEQIQSPDAVYDEGVVVVSVATLPGERRMFEVVVTDNGCGFDNEGQIVRIFEKSYTTKSSGSGQGLHSIVHFVESMGGEISADHGTDGVGAEFRVVLPVVIPE